jgi:hypothetical protein
MSHFSVLVISPTELNKETLRPLLQKWHEFECTGTLDQYVVDVDKTADALEEYAKDTITMMKSADGEMVRSYDDRFYRDPTPEENEKHGWDRYSGGSGCGDGISWTSKDWGDGRGYRTKVKFIPEGWTETEAPVSEVMTQAEFMDYYYSAKMVTSEDQLDREDEHKYGYALVTEDGKLVRYVDRTNPNAKWDWWGVGGRYSAKFAPPGYDPETDPANQEVCPYCVSGKQIREGEERDCPHCDGKGIKTKWPSEWANVGNITQRKDIPLEALRDAAEKRALENYDKAIAVIAGRPYQTWEEVRKDAVNIDDARTTYRSQSVIEDLQKAEVMGMWDGDEMLQRYRLSREEVSAQARTRGVTTFAIVKDGKWYEQGEMGWWGVVHNEKDGTIWNKEVSDLIESLPPDTWLAVVDCHI